MTSLGSYVDSDNKHLGRCRKPAVHDLKMEKLPTGNLGIGIGGTAEAEVETDAASYYRWRLILSITCALARSRPAFWWRICSSVWLRAPSSNTIPEMMTTSSMHAYDSALGPYCVHTTYLEDYYIPLLTLHSIHLLAIESANGVRKKSGIIGRKYLGYPE